MTLHQISNAREKRNARRMRQVRKEIQARNLPAVRAIRAVGIKQEPGSVMLQLFGDIEQKKLLAVVKLDGTGIKDLNDNLRAAAGLEIKEGLIWTPKNIRD